MNSLFLRDDMSNWHYPRPPVIYNCSNMAIKAVKRLYRPINSAYNAWNGLCIFYVKISINSRQIKTKASLKSRKKKILFHDWSLYIIQGFTFYIFPHKEQNIFLFSKSIPTPLFRNYLYFFLSVYFEFLFANGKRILFTYSKYIYLSRKNSRNIFYFKTKRSKIYIYFPSKL